MHRINALPPHMARVQIGANGFTSSIAEAQKGCRGVDGEAAVQLQPDFDLMVRSEFAHFRPIRNHLFLPLPLQNLLVVVRPGSDRPVGVLGAFMVAGAAGEGVDHRHLQLLGQLNGFDEGIMIFLGYVLLRMQRIAMAG
ncbi:hypothetical protein D3C75_781610 [compost metagenome]